MTRAGIVGMRESGGASKPALAAALGATDQEARR